MVGKAARPLDCGGGLPTIPAQARVSTISRPWHRRSS
jgi:hypothetical protein